MIERQDDPLSGAGQTVAAVLGSHWYHHSQHQQGDVSRLPEHAEEIDVIKIRPLVITGTDAELNRLQNEYRQWQGMDTRFDGDTLIVLPRKNRHELGKMIK